MFTYLDVLKAWYGITDENKTDEQEETVNFSVIQLGAEGAVHVAGNEAHRLDK